MSLLVYPGVHGFVCGYCGLVPWMVGHMVRPDFRATFQCGCGAEWVVTLESVKRAEEVHGPSVELPIKSTPLTRDYAHEFGADVGPILKRMPGVPKFELRKNSIYE